MGKICIVKSCPSGRKLKQKINCTSQPVSYFQPRAPGRLKNWKMSLGIELKVTDYICHLHFKQEHIKTCEKFHIGGELKIFATGKKILSNDALPTIEHQYVPITTEQLQVISVNELPKPEHNYPSSPSGMETVNHQETNATAETIQNFRIKLKRSSILPPFWVWADAPNGLEFIRVDLKSQKMRNHIRLNKDFTITVIFPNNDELLLNEKINSSNSIADYLKSVERWPLCIGTQIDNKHSKFCKGVLIGDGKYKKKPQHPRCKSCRLLRNHLQNRNTASSLIENETKQNWSCSKNNKQYKHKTEKKTKNMNCYEHLEDVTYLYPDIYETDDELKFGITSEAETHNFEESDNEQANIDYNENSSTDSDEDFNITEKKEISYKKGFKQEIPNNAFKFTQTHLSSLDIIKDASADDIENYDFIEYLDESILAEDEESVTDNCNTSVTEKANPKEIEVNNVILKNKDMQTNQRISKTTKEITGKMKKRNDNNIDWNLEFDGYGTVVTMTPDDAKKDLLERKYSKNYKMSQYKCELCYKGFGRKLTYENHMQQHSIENGEFECDICHLRLSKANQLSEHKRNCHMTKFHCKLCSFICYTVYRAKAHVDLHKGKEYPCTDCGKKFRVPNSLLTHKRMKHLKNCVTECVCDICGDVFASNFGLSLHRKKLHRMKYNKQGPKCEECGVHFASKKAWSRHLILSSRHTDTLNINNGCKYCGDIFTDEKELRSHIKVNHLQMKRKNTKLPAACSLCKEWLASRTEYNNHMIKEHPQSEEAITLASSDLAGYVCEVCGQAFKCYLTYHQRNHTGERPYTCEECGKSYQMPHSLAVHRLRHTNNNTYTCEKCEKVFYSKHGLYKHVKSHLGIRPHKCMICDQRFPHMCELKLHVKYVHDKVPKTKRKRKFSDNNVSDGNTN